MPRQQLHRLSAAVNPGRRGGMSARPVQCRWNARRSRSAARRGAAAARHGMQCGDQQARGGCVQEMHAAYTAKLCTRCAGALRYVESPLASRVSARAAAAGRAAKRLCNKPAAAPARGQLGSAVPVSMSVLTGRVVAGSGCRMQRCSVHALRGSAGSGSAAMNSHSASQLTRRC